MPFINVKISGQPSQEIANKVTAFLTGHTVATLGKKTEVISVAIEFIPANQWAIGGVSLVAQGVSSFYLDIKVKRPAIFKRYSQSLKRFWES